MNGLDAALYMIRCCEHLQKDVLANEDYSVFYGGTHFTNFADHPCITGEKKGVPLPPDWCKKLGFTDGKCVSTAAGAYQFTKPTWQQYRTVPPYLTDFSRENQDEACRRALRSIGASAFFMEGDMDHGLRLASRMWASLPGSTAGQHTRTVMFAQTAYTEGLEMVDMNRGLA